MPGKTLLLSQRPGGLATFNIQDGFNEALLRGLQLGFLSDADYRSILQCENLADVKLNLQETDYGAYVGDVAQISPSIVREKALEKLVNEFNLLRANANQPLSQFLEFIRYDYMIDNVMLILKATLNNPNVDVASLIKQTHPLGQFEESVFNSICAFENSPKGYAELYQSVLIDTPIGPYFARFLQEESAKVSQDASYVQNLLEELPTTKLESSLRKLYLEDFLEFCQGLGGDTATIMTDVIKARADATAINITLNSFGTMLNDPNLRESERKPLYPSMGFLYPEGTDKLSQVGDEMELAAVLRTYQVYRGIFDKHQRGDKTIDDAFYEREVQLNEMAWEGQFHYAAYYSYVRLKEQEIRNLVWICECIVQRQKDRASDHFVPVFSREASYRKR
ncbi:V-type proton ATPase subunit d [Hondaea fermentalgiana]|uniref:V-type proton ATPase subunit n=1 Tax=Hondaea fermentalgiana TaxID=2315210 RepID=A0A2R5GEZ1_9STRA|nr:V-type proton ATPase subunit d [Hondaea fermentalgiana]|eukprot:GBG27173.1 V-type proton ATPase subunit d [Hondaea fermentalgiana]